MESLVNDSDGSVKDQDANRNETINGLSSSFKWSKHSIGNEPRGHPCYTLASHLDTSLSVLRTGCS